MVSETGSPRADAEPRIQVQVAPKSTAGSAELRQVGTRKSQEAGDFGGSWGAILRGGEEGEGGGEAPV